MAQLPLSATTLKLLSGVPFTDSYQHTRWFDNQSAQESYFNSFTPVLTMNNVRFRDGVSYTQVKVDRPIQDLYGVNYIVFQQANTATKLFYCFVTDMERKNEDVTMIYFTMDVLQTWMFDFTIKPSYIVREHQNRWLSNGDPVINTQEEGLNYGNEYDIVDAKHIRPNQGTRFMVIVAKNRIDNGASNEPTASYLGAPQGLVYYVVPFLPLDFGANVMVNGDVYPMNTVTEVLQDIFSVDSVANAIANIYMTDHFGLNPTYVDSSPSYIEFSGLIDAYGVVIGESNVLLVKEIASFQTQDIELYSDKYSGFDSVEESKLMMHPYCLTVIDDLKGNRIEVKNEYVENDHLTVATRGSIGTANKVTYTVKGYNYHASEDLQDDVLLESGVINANPQSMAFTNDSLTAFLQGERNSLMNRMESIKFNGLMGAIGNSIGVGSSLAMRNPTGVASSSTSMVQGLGNSVLEMQGLSAKLQDIDNRPSQLQSMGNNTSYDEGYNIHGLFVIKKQIKPEYRERLTEFFKAYGYKSNQIKTPNLHTRNHFNYVQTKACNLIGNLNTSDLTKLASIFDNGITLWHTNDIGNYSLSNGEV